MKDLRPCVVNEKAALFHTFEQYSEIVSPSFAIGGHGGGVIAEVFAIVEYEDGKVGRVDISSLRFTDKQQADKNVIQSIHQNYKPAEKKTRCKHCQNSDNLNAVIFSDSKNKEYFVYCRSCGIETIETYKSKKTAINAFDSGETKKIKEVAEDGKADTTSTE